MCVSIYTNIGVPKSMIHSLHVKLFKDWRLHVLNLRLTKSLTSTFYCLVALLMRVMTLKTSAYI